MMKKILSIFVLAAMCTGVGWSETFIIRLSRPTEKSIPDKDEKQRIAALEDGLMDILFINGHVFFNTYSWMNSEDMETSPDMEIQLIEETGADYYIELEPDESGTSWKLFNSNTIESPDNDVLSGFETLSRLIPEENIYKRWESLGQNVGRIILNHIL